MRGVFCAAVALGGFLATAPAFAGDPATLNALQLGLGFRYGVEMNEGDFNPWKAGLGIDAGYTLPNAVYVGGTFEYFFGETIDVGGVETKGNVWDLMAEGGYDVGLGENFVVRPKLGAGIGTQKHENCVSGPGCNSDSSSKLELAPGVKLMLITPRFGLSLDTRLAMIFADTTAKALVFTVGIGF